MILVFLPATCGGTVNTRLIFWIGSILQLSQIACGNCWRSGTNRSRPFALDDVHAAEIKEYLDLLDLTQDVDVRYLPDVSRKIPAGR